MIKAESAKIPKKFTFRRTLRFDEIFYGWLFIIPAILGLLLFKLGPVFASLYFSFTKYDIITAPKWIGLQNYSKLLTDQLWLKSVTVTLHYTALFIPLSVIVAYIIALLMAQELKGIAVYRTLWYLPSLVPSVASATLWRWAMNPEFGPINYPIKLLGFAGPGWLTDPKLIIFSVVLIQLWALGSSALVFLASIKGVPETFHEAAKVDGASTWQRFWNITIPLTSPVIFFQLIMSVIGSFQVFGIVFVLFGGMASTDTAGPNNSALFYVLYLYRNAFGYFRNGYASAMAWVLFAVIMLLTFLIFRTQTRWVYYETEAKVE